MSKHGNIIVRKNSGGNVGTRRRVNLREGANITLTIVDSGPNDEVDILIASAGGAGTAWLDQFYPTSDPDGYYGTYATMLMADGLNTTIRQTFLIPNDIATIVRASLVIIPEGTGNLYWSTATNFAAICSNEDYQINTDSIALNTDAVDTDQVECVDFTAALTGGVGDDIVGIEFVRAGEHANDTVGADVHFLGIIIQGSI